jgi:hypothetical protein
VAALGSTTAEGGHVTRCGLCCDVTARDVLRRNARDRSLKLKDVITSSICTIVDRTCLYFFTPIAVDQDTTVLTVLAACIFYNFL